VLPFLQRVTPQGLVVKTKRDLTLAGMNDIAPEEMVSLQAVLAGVGLLLGIGFQFTHPRPGLALMVLLFLPAMGAMTPMVIVKRKAKERSEAIFKDLPDCLDLMAISVEAGVGFEAALDVVCKNFDSQLALEFRRTLKEMELGVSRREALSNLRTRNDVPELSNFVTALIQADALGMPVGRVLHTQAVELRNRRRQWAREKAAKLPVKILFPLVFFIFPAILVIILGPAAARRRHHQGLRRHVEEALRLLALGTPRDERAVNEAFAPWQAIGVRPAHRRGQRGGEACRCSAYRSAAPRYGRVPSLPANVTARSYAAFRSAYRGLASMNSRTNQQRARTFLPRLRTSSSAARTSCSPKPCPRSEGLISVCGNTTVLPCTS
jgi:tight adherence protein C